MKISIIAVIAAITLPTVGGYAIEDEDFGADPAFLANTDVEVEDVNAQRELGGCYGKYWGWYHGKCHAKDLVCLRRWAYHHFFFFNQSNVSR